jgi:superfamily II DNA/RNA helicase
MKLAEKFCRCIKSVGRTLKVRKNKNKEPISIAICTKSMLQQARKRTLKKFKCGKKPELKTQALLD